MKALVVEDNPANQKVMLRQLKRLAVAAEVVDCVEDAKIRWQAEQFDIALVDLRLPGASGVELARWLRQQATGPDLPIVLVTADRVTTHSEAKEPGLFNAFLTKPVSIDALAGVIAALTGQGMPVGQSSAGADGDKPIHFPHVDTRVLARYVGNEPELYPGLVVQFIEVMDQGIASLRAKSLEPDDEIEFIAHKLKSTCRTMGSHVLTDGFEQLELLCRQGGAVDAVVSELLVYWQGARQELVVALADAGVELTD